MTATLQLVEDHPELRFLHETRTACVRIVLGNGDKSRVYITRDSLSTAIDNALEDDLISQEEHEGLMASLVDLGMVANTRYLMLRMHEFSEGEDTGLVSFAACVGCQISMLHGRLVRKGKDIFQNPIFSQAGAFDQVAYLVAEEDLTSVQGANLLTALAKKHSMPVELPGLNAEALKALFGSFGPMSVVISIVRPPKAD